jgi:predicted Kef-type K+ transport protein
LSLALTFVKEFLVPHDVDLIILLAVGFGIALFFGYIAARLRLPPSLVI